MSDNHVFLSYRSTERDFAARLRDDLTRNGVNVWMDEHGGIEGGDDWRQTIQDAVDSAVGMVALISPGYLGSKWCTRELNRADSNNIPIIPAYLERVDSLPIVIEGIQYVDFREARDHRSVYDASFAELLEQVREKTSMNPVEAGNVVTKRPRRRRSRSEWTLYGVIMLVLAVLAIVVEVVDDPLVRLQQGWTRITAPAEAALFNPSVEELSFAVEREALMRDLETVSSPRGLVAAPAASGYAVWGYGDANAALFLADVGSGEVLFTMDLPDALGDDFLPRGLHYDGVWLWLGDARNDRAVALDPLNISGGAVAEFNLSGDPSAMAHTGEILWVAQAETDTVTALAVAHEAGEVSRHCPAVDVSDPRLLALQGSSAVWVAGEGAISTINVQSCEVTPAFTLDAALTALVWSGETLWFVGDGALYRLGTDDAEPARLDIPNATITDLLVTDSGLWLDTDDDRLLLYDPGSGETVVEIAGDAPINALAANGRQVWAAREDNTLARYIVPDLVYPGLIEIAWADETLWVVSSTDDGDYELCAVTDERRRCQTLELEAEPVTLAADRGALWLGTSDNRLHQIDPASSAVIESFAIDGITTPATVVPVDGEVWVSDGFTLPVVLDPATGMQTQLESLNVNPTAAFAYDGATVWFADAFTGQLFPVERDGEALTAGEADELPMAGVSVLVATDAGLVAVAPGSAYVIDPTSGDVQRVIGVGGAVGDVAIEDDGLWIADAATGFIYSAD